MQSKFIKAAAVITALFLGTLSYGQTKPDTTKKVSPAKGPDGVYGTPGNLYETDPTRSYGIKGTKTTDPTEKRYTDSNSYGRADTNLNGQIGAAGATGSKAATAPKRSTGHTGPKQK